MAATKRENLITGDNDAENFTSSNWVAQTFTAESNHSVSKFVLKLINPNSEAGTATVSLRATSSGLPTGSDLASGTLSLASISASGGWYDITLDTPYNITNGVVYSIVIRSDIGNGVGWRLGGNNYGNGSQCKSANSGSSWTAYTSYDQMFEVWGENVSQNYTKEVSDTLTMSENVQKSISKIKSDIMRFFYRL